MTACEANPAWVELRSASGQRFTTTASSQIFMRARGRVNVCGDVNNKRPRRLAFRTQPNQSDKWLTEATSSYFAVLAGRSSTRDMEVGLRLKALVVCTG